MCRAMAVELARHKITVNSILPGWIKSDMTAGIMANDDDLREAVHDASKRAGESAWPMPSPEELRANLDSSVADIMNIPLVGRPHGGMLTGGIFLKEFVKDGQRWAHLDIAGTAWLDAPTKPYLPKGGTGAGVRLVTEFLRNFN